MDDALRKRLDAIVGLLAVVALLSSGIVVAVGGASLLALLGLVGFVAAMFAWTAREVRAGGRDVSSEVGGGRDSDSEVEEQ